MTVGRPSPLAAARELIASPEFAAVLDPFDEWAHQCHAASLHLVKSGICGPDARVARGVCRGVPGQHSWVVLGRDCYQPKAILIDPTLWSYRDDVIGVWVGRASQFGHAPHGSGSIWKYGRPPAPVDEPVELTPTVPLSPVACRFLDMCGPLDRRGWMFLASAPVEGWPAAEIITAMDDTVALGALVPIDRLGMLTDRNPDGLYLAA